MLVGRARSSSLTRKHKTKMGKLLAWTNIMNIHKILEHRALGSKKYSSVSNGLAYRARAIIDSKSFITSAPNVIKLFPSIIYEFS
jgi:hypothetical protein